MSIADAQHDRSDRGRALVFPAIDNMVEMLADEVDMHLASVPNYELVTPMAKHKLKSLIDHYRALPHPWTSCVRDNTKRFGADGAKRVCSVLTDLEKGTTHWRNGAKKTALAEQHMPAPISTLDNETIDLLERISRVDYKTIISEVN